MSSLNPNAPEFTPKQDITSYTEDEWGYATLTYESHTVQSIDPVIYCSYAKYTPTFKWQENKERNYVFYLHYFDGAWPNFVKNKDTILKLWADYKKVRAEKKQKQDEENKRKEEEIKKKEQEEADKKRIFPIKSSIAPTNPWKKV